MSANKKASASVSETARTAGGCGRAGAAKAPALSPAYRRRGLHIPRSAASSRTHSFRRSYSPHRNRSAGLRRGPRGPSETAHKSVHLGRWVHFLLEAEEAAHNGPQAITEGLLLFTATQFLRIPILPSPPPVCTVRPVDEHPAPHETGGWCRADCHCA